MWELILLPGILVTLPMVWVAARLLIILPFQLPPSTAAGASGVRAARPAAAAPRPALAQTRRPLTAALIVPVPLLNPAIPSRVKFSVPAHQHRVALPVLMLVAKHQPGPRIGLVIPVMAHGVVGVLARLQLPPILPATGIPARQRLMPAARHSQTALFNATVPVLPLRPPILPATGTAVHRLPTPADRPTPAPSNATVPVRPKLRL